MAELYEPLPPRTIRLLRVLPGDTEAPMECELLLLPMPESSGQMQLYEALSYVWGSEDKPRSILVSGHLVHIGTNLYQALLRLRHRVLDRVLWIDAICINQADTGEKSQQIPLMSQIYHQAGRVIVWLGVEADDSTRALDVIINANGNRSNSTRSRHPPSPSAQGNSSSDEPRMENRLEGRLFDEHDSSPSVSIYSSSDDEVFHADTDSQQSVESGLPDLPQHPAASEDDLNHWHMDNATQAAIFAVLTRPWFRRIWVLQEVSSSRYTLMVCGSAEVNGYAFCLGVLALSDLLKKRLDIFGWIMPVVNLMTTSTLEPNRANLMPLGELVDMYHTRYSTMPHDMLYALQGLCSESFEDIGVLVDYSKGWDQVFYSFLRVLFPEASRFHVPADGRCAGIRHAAKIIGKVIAVENFAQRGGFQETIIQRRTNMSNVYDNQTWHVPNSANSIQTGDFICLFEGNMRPAVVRAQRDYFELLIVAPSWEKQGMSRTDWQNVADFETKFDLLPFVWDWQRHGKVDRGDYHQNLLRTVLDLNHLIDPRDISLARLKRLWDIAMAISPLSSPRRDIQDTEDSRLEAMKIHSKSYGFSPNDMHKLNGFPLLSLAASHGSYQLAQDLLRNGADVNLADRNGKTALCYAEERGDVDLAEYFLANGAQRSSTMYSQSSYDLNRVVFNNLSSILESWYSSKEEFHRSMRGTS
ncbi:hypothetical protein PFICI_01701 [Pestalotiopsis fici W106-1]|uniref:Heterokaryon incompatibility domain-containing protein n=1 Tax=Pestalotiopsis fici (strain W106-1 / CGMCC3.15140) TaxID=1229662 RepID=W3XP88_PESFW|nr:uncharacterized protein PFICI_01701 [Pestalotiopsis fici W106-1]ETS87873.1 hypothetical protein PFICI_01701 [Pestalotiopsis fici W106-1]